MPASSLGQAWEVWIDETEARMAGAVTEGVRAATKAGVASLRAHLDAAFPGSRGGAGGFVTSISYPQPGKPARLDAVGFVFPRNDRAEKIIAAWTEGVTIRSADGFWLAIPTDAVPRDGRGRKLTPGALEQRMGIRLRLVPAVGRMRSALLVADGLTAARNGRGWRQATGRRLAQGRETQPVLMYVLVPEVTLARRLNPETAVKSGFDTVLSQIDRAYRSRR